MWVNIAVSLLNIVLDALLIGYFKLGIEAAAWASVLSMLIGTLIFLYPFIMKKVALRFTKPKVDVKEFLYVIYNGSSVFLGNISLCRRHPQGRRHRDRQADAGGRLHDH